LMVKVLCAAASVKSFKLMLSAMGTVVVKPLPAAVRLRVKPVMAMVWDTATLSWTALVTGMVVADKVVVIPAGAPVKVRASGALKAPCTEVQLSERVYDWPGFMSMGETGYATPILQEGAGAMVRVRGIVWVTPPPLAVSVAV